MRNFNVYDKLKQKNKPEDSDRLKKFEKVLKAINLSESEMEQILLDSEQKSIEEDKKTKEKLKREAEIKKSITEMDIQSGTAETMAPTTNKLPKNELPSVMVAENPKQAVPTLGDILNTPRTSTNETTRVAAPSGGRGRPENQSTVFGATNLSTPAGSKRAEFARTPKTEGLSTETTENDSPTVKIELIIKKLKEVYEVDVKDDGTYPRGGIFGGNKKRAEKLLKTDPEFKQLIDQIITLSKQ